MEKSSSIFNSKRFPKGCVITVVMIIIIELLVIRFDDYFYFPPYNNLRMKVKNDIALSDQHSYEVLILGDSYNLTGLYPRLISEQTGLSVFNFSTFAVNSIFSSYVLFKNQLQSSLSKPDYLIIGYLDYIPQMDRNKVLKRYGHTFFDFKRGNLIAFIQEFGLAVGLKQLLPSLKHQGYFLLMAKPTPIDIIISVEKSVYEDHGFYEWRGKSEFDGNYGYENDSQEFAVTPFFDRNIRKILKLAQENNVRVLYIIPSVVPILNERLKKNGRRKAYREYIDELQKTYTNLDIMYPQDQLNSAKLYADQDHLNQEGGWRLLSQMVSDWIQTNLME